MECLFSQQSFAWCGTRNCKVLAWQLLWVQHLTNAPQTPPSSARLARKARPTARRAHFCQQPLRRQKHLHPLPVGEGDFTPFVAGHAEHPSERAPCIEFFQRRDLPSGGLRIGERPARLHAEPRLGDVEIDLRVPPAELQSPPRSAAAGARRTDSPATRGPGRPERCSTSFTDAQRRVPPRGGRTEGSRFRATLWVGNFREATEKLKPR